MLSSSRVILQISGWLQSQKQMTKLCPKSHSGCLSPLLEKVIVQCQEFHICKLRIMLLLHSALKPADEACACSVYCYVLPRPQLANQQHRMQFRKIVGESKLHLVLFQKVMFGKWSNQIYLLHCELRTKICYLCFWYKATCTWEKNVFLYFYF